MEMSELDKKFDEGEEDILDEFDLTKAERVNYKQNWVWSQNRDLYEALEREIRANQRRKYLIPVQVILLGIVFSSFSILSTENRLIDINREILYLLGFLGVLGDLGITIFMAISSKSSIGLITRFLKIRAINISENIPKQDYD